MNAFFTWSDLSHGAYTPTGNRKRDKKRREPLGCDPAAVLVPFSCDCVAPVPIRRAAIFAADEHLYQAPLIVDVEPLDKIAKNIQVLIARFANFLFDAISALAQYP